jgi:hypothetical protein
LLIKNPKKRIGYLDLSEIKNHIWIKDYPWDKLLNKEITPPFVPVNSDYNFDINHVNKKENINKQTKKLYKRWLKNNSIYDNPFKYFNYNETNLLFTKNESKLNKTPSTANHTPDTENHTNKKDRNINKHTKYKNVIIRLEQNAVEDVDNAQFKIIQGRVEKCKLQPPIKQDTPVIKPGIKINFN